MFRFFWIDIALARARLDLGSGEMLDRLPSIGRYDLSLAESADDQSAYHRLRRMVLFEARGRFDYIPDGPEEIKERNLSLLFKLDGQAIGTVRLDQKPDGRAIVRLVTIAPDLQRRGHGTTLLERVERLALSLGIRDHLVHSPVGEWLMSFAFDRRTAPFWRLSTSKFAVIGVKLLDRNARGSRRTTRPLGHQVQPPIGGSRRSDERPLATTARRSKHGFALCRCRGSRNSPPHSARHRSPR